VIGNVAQVDAAIGGEGYRTLGGHLTRTLRDAGHRGVEVDAGTVGVVVYASSRTSVLRAATAIATIVGLRTEVQVGDVGRDDDQDEGLRFFVAVHFSWGAFS